MSRVESFQAAGVPVVLRFPEHQDEPAPLIIFWHGFGPPRSEQALAQTLPLEGIHAWRAYLGLPLFGARMPEGGSDELMRRQLEDYVLQLLLPVVESAVRELPEVIKALQNQFPIQLEPGIGLFGFSAGGSAALLALFESKVAIAAAVLAGVAINLSSAVDAVERAFNLQYRWTEASLAASRRLDFGLRTGEIAKGTQPPAILLLHGENDEIYPPAQAEQLYTALRPYYERAGCPKRLSMKILAHLGHQIEPPSDEMNRAVRADFSALQAAVTNWFREHLLFVS